MSAETAGVNLMCGLDVVGGDLLVNIGQFDPLQGQVRVLAIRDSCGVIPVRRRGDEEVVLPIAIQFLDLRVQELNVSLAHVISVRKTMRLAEFLRQDREAAEIVPEHGRERLDWPHRS